MTAPTIVFPQIVTNLSGVTRRLYPQLFGYLPARQHKTDVEEAFDGSEQTRARYDADAFGGWAFTTQRLDPREAYGIRNFLAQIRGKANRFWFTTPDERWSDDKKIGVTNGGDVHDLNVQDISGFYSLTVGGTPWSDYVIIVEAGTYGQDLLIFTGSLPGSGQEIRMQTFFAREVHIARMDSDKEVETPFAGGADATQGTFYPTARLNTQFQFAIRGAR